MLRSPLTHEKCSSESDITHLLDRETEPELAATPRAKRRRFADSSINDCKLDQILALITKQDARLGTLEGHIRDLKAQSTSIQSTNTDIVKSIDGFTEQISLIQAKIDCLESKRQDMSFDLAKLEDKVDRFERFAVKTSIEIRQVPKKPKESKDNLFTSLKSLSSTIGLPLEKSVVRDIFRLPSKSTDTKSTVVVEFANTFTKKDFLHCAKKRNQSTRLSSKDLGIEGDQAPIYISEHLTAKSRHLYYLSRDVAKTYHFAFCWTANGQVFLRKEEGEPHVIIKSELQLEDIKNKLSQ